MVSGWICTIASIVAFWAGVWAGRIISQHAWHEGWNAAIKFIELQEKEKKEAAEIDETLIDKTIDNHDLKDGDY